MAAGVVSLKNLTKCETARKLKKELIRLYVNSDNDWVELSQAKTS